jgi:hypothetical protein
MGARQQRTTADEVSPRMVVQADGDLDESLQKLALGLWRGAPDVFEDLVSVEELLFVEQS